MFVVALDPNGAYRWDVTRGGTAGDEVRGLEIDPATGRLIVVGSYGGTVDFGGGPRSVKGGTDGFVLGLEANGAYAWDTVFGSTGLDSPQRVAIAPGGNLIVTGSHTAPIDFGGGLRSNGGGADVFLLSLSKAGAYLWDKTFPLAGHQEGWCVATNTKGQIVVGGLFDGTIDFGGGARKAAGEFDAFVVGFDATGGYLWDRAYGSSLRDAISGVAFDSSSDLWVTGYFEQNIDFGAGPHTPQHYSDVFVLKLKPAW